jgi:hypothetical protein
MPSRIKQVIKQTTARLFRGDTRTEGKIFSLFEPSTENIRKGKAGKPNELGKMVKLQEAENQIVIDYEVYDPRPSDSNLLVPAIETHQETWMHAAPCGSRCRFLPKMRRQTKQRVSSVSAFAIGPQRAPSANASRRSADSQRPEVADRMRGTYHCGQAAARSQSLPVQR